MPENPTYLGEYDVAVIGGGIIGSMVARELCRMKGRFALLERETFPGFGISKASLSQIHLPDFCPPGSLKGRLCKDAPDRFKALARELDAEYKEMGELWLALEPSHMDNLHAARHRGEANGAKGYEIIGPDKIRDLEPHIAPNVVAALYAGGVGVIYTPEWTAALVENAVQNGLTPFLDTAVQGIAQHDDGAFAIATNRGVLSAKYIVNAAGLYADAVAQMVGDDHLHMSMRKGTILIFDKSVSHLVSNMLFGTLSADHSQDIAPTSHGNLILGIHYVKTDDKGNTRVTSEGIRETFKLGKQMIPALSEKDVITSFSGILPTPAMSPDGDFYIAPSDSAPGMIHVMVGAPGLSAAPGVADYVINMLCNGGLALPVNKGFKKQRNGWPRFEGLSASERADIIAGNPKCGHILCRCEHVTEAEIATAIKNGAHTMDAVKHLTRAGMGRCQGGFCGISVIKQLSARLAIPPTEVTKKGKGSEQITGFTREADSDSWSSLS